MKRIACLSVCKQANISTHTFSLCHSLPNTLSLGPCASFNSAAPSSFLRFTDFVNTYIITHNCNAKHKNVTDKQTVFVRDLPCIDFSVVSLKVKQTHYIMSDTASIHYLFAMYSTSSYTQQIINDQKWQLKITGATFYIFFTFNKYMWIMKHDRKYES